MTQDDKHHGAPRTLSDGVEDHLEPLDRPRPAEVRSFDDLRPRHVKTAFSGRALGEAADVLTAMAEDPDCLVVATLLGRDDGRQDGTVIVRMIEAGMIARDREHRRADGARPQRGGRARPTTRRTPRISDEALFEKGYNRVYDTLEMEKNLNAIDEFVRGELDKLDANEPWSSELHLPAPRQGARRRWATRRASSGART